MSVQWQWRNVSHISYICMFSTLTCPCHRQRTAHTDNDRLQVEVQHESTLICLIQKCWGHVWVLIGHVQGSFLTFVSKTAFIGQRWVGGSALWPCLGWKTAISLSDTINPFQGLNNEQLCHSGVGVVSCRKTLDPVPEAAPNINTFIEIEIMWRHVWPSRVCLEDVLCK